MKLSQGMVLFLSLSLALGLTLTYFGQIAEPKVKAEREAKARSLMEKMKPSSPPNLHLETFSLFAPHYLHLGDLQSAGRFIDNDKVIQVVYRALSHEGYAGTISLMASFDQDCKLAHLEILSEHETPGLGDQYKRNEGAWLKQFSGLSEYSSIDTWTGATVTPKAIIHAVEELQELCTDAHSLLFSTQKEVYFEISTPDENLR